MHLVWKITTDSEDPMRKHDDQPPRALIFGKLKEDGTMYEYWCMRLSMNFISFRPDIGHANCFYAKL